MGHTRRRHGMFFKLFAASLVFALVLFGLLMFSTGVRAKNLLEDREVVHSQALIRRNDEYLDLYLESLKNLLVMAGEITDAAGSDNGAVEAILEAVADNNPATIGRMYLVRGDQTVITSNRLVYDIVGHPTLSEVARLVGPETEGVVWSEPYRSPQLVGRTVAFARAVDVGDGPRSGVLIVEINLQHLTGVLEDVISQDYQTFVVLTSGGNVVMMERSSTLLPYEPKVLPHRVQHAFVSRLIDLPRGIGSVTYEGTSLTTVKSRSNHLGWDLVVLIENAAFREQVSQLYGSYLRIGIIVFLVIVAGTYLLSRHFSRPIHELALTMDRIRAPEQFAFHVAHRDDEIGLLYHSFDRLLNRVRELLEVQRRAERTKRRMEIEILQNQIKPHFLGNTLACIASLAKQDRSREAEEMIRSLILLLTNSIDNADELVTLEHELRCVDAYVRLQKMRYGNRFEYHDEVRDAFRTCRVPKLVLEPVIENCIFHGFSDRTGGNLIRVSARSTGEAVSIRVEDDGIGLSEERLQSVRAMLSNRHDADDHRQSGRYSSIGLKNVTDRIRLLYGDDYGLTIGSTLGRGTVVVVRVPDSRAAGSRPAGNRAS